MADHGLVILLLGIPDSRARCEILTALLKKIPNTLTLAEIDHLASISHGYVGADLAAVCREAGLKTINRIMGKRHPFFAQDGGDAALALQDQFRAMSVSGAKRDDPSTEEEQGPEELLVSAQDMKLAMTDVKPSAMREVMIEVPKVLWSDIGGQAEIKQKLKESVEWPLQVRFGVTLLGIMCCLLRQSCWMVYPFFFLIFDSTQKRLSAWVFDHRRAFCCMDHPGAVKHSWLRLLRHKRGLTSLLSRVQR